MKTLIYDDEGVSVSLQPAVFRHFLGATSLSAKELIKGDWKADVLVMPGGRDRPYHAALAGEGNRIIKKFVENGGTYYGICAGAYYGCRIVDFERGHPLEVVEERELCFFNGSAIGSAYGLGLFSYNSRKGAKWANIQTKNGLERVFFHGGPYFAGDFSNVKVLGTYADLPGTPPAIIECTVGKGRAILSGVHVEMGLKSLL